MGYTHGKYWNDNLIKEAIYEVMKTLNLNRMPTRQEILSVRKSGDLCSAICRTKGYYGWIKELGLNIKESETTLGKQYEYKVKDLLESKGYTVEKMPQNYPFDLLINENIKVDVKVGRPYIDPYNSRWHTFNLYKKYASCDLYIIVCLDEKENIEKLLIIPSYRLKIKQLSLGKESIYDTYKDRFDYIDVYDNFYQDIQ